MVLRFDHVLLFRGLAILPVFVNLTGTNDDGDDDSEVGIWGYASCGDEGGVKTF